MIMWITATLVAFFIKGLCGFANTLVFTSILSFADDNVNISPVELVLGYPTNIIMVIKERKSVNLKLCIPLAAMVMAGAVPGALFLKNADTGIIKTVFGVIIILIGLEMLLREIKTKSKAKQSKVVMLIIGILSGILCGLYGIGALLGAYLGRVTDDSHSFKANICAVFAVENTFRIALYSLWGIITWDILRQAFILMPVMLIGLFLGMASGRFLDEKIVKKVVIVMLIISGAVLVWTSLAG